MTPHHPEQRLYTRFIAIAKAIQYLGFFIVVIFGVLFMGFSLQTAPLIVAIVIPLLQILLACSFIYLITQGTIAIVDLLSRIERNTRSSGEEI